MADFAAEVRRLMSQRGMSLRGLGRAAGYDPSYLSKILSGRKPASPFLARCLDDALGAGGAIEQAAARPGPAAPVPAGDVQGPVAPELVAYFSGQLAGHYTADRYLGPARLIPVALSQYQLVCDLAGAAGGSLRGDLWSLAAGYAALAGWLYQDAGKLEKSAYWLDVMIERAHRSQDIQLVGFALHNKAMLLADMGDGRGVLDLTGAALRQRSQLCPKVQVLLLQQAAHGTSLASDSAAAGTAGRLLDEAAGLLAAVGDDYPWGGSCLTPGYLDVQRATICTRLGLAGQALELWEQIIPGIPGSARRDLGVFRARQAQALADAGEPEQAVEVAAQVVPLVAQTGSARMRAELSRLRRHMSRWAGQPPGQALAGLLTALPAR